MTLENHLAAKAQSINRETRVVRNVRLNSLAAWPKQIEPALKESGKIHKNASLFGTAISRPKSRPRHSERHFGPRETCRQCTSGPQDRGLRPRGCCKPDEEESAVGSGPPRARRASATPMSEDSAAVEILIVSSVATSVIGNFEGSERRIKHQIIICSSGLFQCFVYFAIIRTIILVLKIYPRNSYPFFGPQKFRCFEDIFRCRVNFNHLDIVTDLLKGKRSFRK